MLYLIRSYKIIHINNDIIFIKRLRSVLLLRSLFFIIIITTFSMYSLIVNFKKPIFENFIQKLLELLSDWPSQWLTVIAPVIVLVLFIPSLVKAITGEIYEFNNLTKKVFKNNKELTIFDKINNILLKFTKGEGDPGISKILVLAGL